MSPVTFSSARKHHIKADFRDGALGALLPCAYFIFLLSAFVAPSKLKSDGGGPAAEK